MLTIVFIWKYLLLTWRFIFTFSWHTLKYAVYFSTSYWYFCCLIAEWFSSAWKLIEILRNWKVISNGRFKKLISFVKFFAHSFQGWKFDKNFNRSEFATFQKENPSNPLIRKTIMASILVKRKKKGFGFILRKRNFKLIHLAI